MKRLPRSSRPRTRPVGLSDSSSSPKLSRAPKARSLPATSAVVSLALERGPHRGLARAELLRRIYAMIDALQLKDIEVSFLLTDDKRIHQLNKIYRHKDRPTDVLAFAMREGDFADLAGAALGDVIVSVPTARKQAAERGASVLDEVTMLLAHGLLHLLGWDHDTPAKDRRMRAETDRLCRAAEPTGALRGPRRVSKTGGGRARADAAGERSIERGARKPAGSRSKEGADPALSRNPAGVRSPPRGRKGQAPHRVQTRRSPKG